MSVESFIKAMPKAELHVHLEGAMQKSTLMMIAEQNEVQDSLKHFNNWVKLVDHPDYAKLDDLIRTTAKWLQHPEDLTRITYELGVHLAKQNVRYAEITVSPTLYAENITLDQFMVAINDGRDRAQRAWGIRLNWILAIPREEPRTADDILRVATSASARKAGVIGLGLVGREDAQPVGQFERAFRMAEKKGLSRVVHAGGTRSADGLLDAIHTLSPNRITGGWGAADAPDVLSLLQEKEIALEIDMAEALCLNRIETYSQYPLRHLVDDGVMVTVSAGRPSLYKTSLNDEFAAILNHNDFAVDELKNLALNAVRASFLPDEEKTDLLAGFAKEFAQLSDEHLTSQVK